MAACGMAWERQSDPGRRWQLCYDLSARSWWMVGRILPLSRSLPLSLFLSLQQFVHLLICLCLSLPLALRCRTWRPVDVLRVFRMRAHEEYDVQLSMRTRKAVPRS